MSDYMPKFYTLEDMTQEDLNKLALERNTYIKEIERLEGEKESLNSLVNSCQREIRRLNNIIKEAREYIGSKEHYEDTFDTEIEKINKILDKENK